jgi:hypothetical protein
MGAAGMVPSVALVHRLAWLGALVAGPVVADTVDIVVGSHWELVPMLVRIQVVGAGTVRAVALVCGVVDDGDCAHRGRHHGHARGAGGDRRGGGAAVAMYMT